MASFGRLAAPAIAVAAMLCSAAPVAATLWIPDGGGPSGGDGKGVQKFGFGAVNVECSTSFALSGRTAATTKLEMKPSLGAPCTMNSLSAEASLSNCIYVLLEPLAGTLWHEEMEILNAGSSHCLLKLEGKAGSYLGCEIKVEKQPSSLKQVEEEVLPSKLMEMAFVLKGIKYSHSGPCSGIGSGSDGTYNGEFTLEGLEIE
jgi:hypothetical protein